MVKDGTPRGVDVPFLCVGGEGQSVIEGEREAAIS